MITIKFPTLQKFIYLHDEEILLDPMYLLDEEHSVYRLVLSDIHDPDNINLQSEYFALSEFIEQAKQEFNHTQLEDKQMEDFKNTISEIVFVSEDITVKFYDAIITKSFVHGFNFIEIETSIENISFKRKTNESKTTKRTRKVTN
jgi:hypothetical protein